MIARLGLLGLGGLCALIPSPALAAQSGAASLKTRLERSQIYQGESVRYSVEVENVENPPAPDLSRFSQFDVELLGRSQNSSSFTVMINGRQVTQGSQGVIFNYLLTPREAGDLIIPEPTLQVDGTRLTGPSQRLHVIRPEKQDLVHFHLKVERNGRYPLQPFVVRLLIFVRKLPEPYSGEDPLAYLSQPPELYVPWADVQDGLQAEDLSSWLSPLRARGRGRSAAYGFGINDLTFQTNSLFGRARSAVFDLGGRPAAAADVEGVPELAGRAGEYFVYELRRRFVPERPGRFHFGAVSIKGSVITGVNGTTPVTREIFDVGGAGVVAVEDAPEADRPASYQGAFGTRFALAVAVAPRRARVGDPLTVTLTLTGQGNLAQAGPPDLKGDPTFTDLFRVEQPTVDQDASRAIYTFSVRPLSFEVAEFPAVPYSYFDLQKERYVTIHSDPVRIEVDRIESLGQGDIIQGDRSDRAPGSFTRAEGTFGNITDPTEVRQDTVDLRALLAYLGSLLSIHVLLVLWVRRRRRLFGDPVRIRRRRAVPRARERMDRALAFLAAGDGAAAAEAFESSLGGLVADAAGIPEGGLTAREVSDRLRQLCVEDQLRERASGLLETCEGLRYGGDVETLPADEPGRLLEDLIGALRRGGRLR